MQSNATVIAGRLTDRPVTKQSRSGKPYCQFAIAVNRSAQGDVVDYFDCATFGKNAERLGIFGKKGALVLVSGRLQQDRWQDQSGMKRSKVVIIADRVSLGQVEDGFVGMAAPVKSRPSASSEDGYRVQEVRPETAAGRAADQTVAGANASPQDAPF